MVTIVYSRESEPSTFWLISAVFIKMHNSKMLQTPDLIILEGGIVASAFMISLLVYPNFPQFLDRQTDISKHYGTRSELCQNAPRGAV